MLTKNALMPGTDGTNLMPDGFVCPYKKQCWQRETIRLLAAVVIAAIVGGLSACTFKLRAPGLDFDMGPTYPSAAQIKAATTQP